MQTEDGLAQSKNRRGLGTQTREPFLEHKLVPKRSLLDGFVADRRGSITAVQPYPLVLLCDRDERSPSWPVGVNRIFPNDIVAGLAVAVKEIMSGVGRT